MFFCKVWISHLIVIYTPRIFTFKTRFLMIFSLPLYPELSSLITVKWSQFCEKKEVLGRRQACAFTKSPYSLFLNQKLDWNWTVDDCVPTALEHLCRVTQLLKQFYWILIRRKTQPEWKGKRLVAQFSLEFPLGLQRSNNSGLFRYHTIFALRDYWHIAIFPSKA